MIGRQHRAGFSQRQDLVAHEMKSNYLWLLRGIMEMALNSFSDHRAQIVNGVCFGGDAVANGSCHIAAVYQVLRDFENDFHIDSVS